MSPIFPEASTTYSIMYSATNSWLAYYISSIINLSFSSNLHLYYAPDITKSINLCLNFSSSVLGEPGIPECLFYGNYSFPN